MKWFLSRESVVYGPFCNLTAVMVLAHMLLGCCWHHRHACGDEPACTINANIARVKIAADDCCSHPCGQELGCPGEPADPEHNGRDGCEGGRCVFVGAQPSRTPAGSATELGDVAAVAVTVVDGLPAESSVSTRAFAATRRCPALRTHLYQQVLLL